MVRPTYILRVGKKFKDEIERLRNDFQFKFNHRVTHADMSDKIVDYLHSKKRRRNEPFMEI